MRLVQGFAPATSPFVGVEEAAAAAVNAGGLRRNGAKRRCALGDALPPELCTLKISGFGDTTGLALLTAASAKLEARAVSIPMLNTTVLEEMEQL